MVQKWFEVFRASVIVHGWCTAMRGLRRMSSALLLPFALLSLPHTDAANVTTYREEVESSLRLVHAVATGATGALCVTHRYGRLRAPLHTVRWDTARARADLAANVLHQLGLETAEVLMAVSQALVLGASPSERAVGSRALALRSDGVVNSAVAWERYGSAEPVAVVSPQLEKPPDTEYPWYVSAHESETLRSPKFMSSPPGATMEGWWTYPYYSCEAERWLLSYTVPVSATRGLRGIISLDIDISSLEINQCEAGPDNKNDNQIYSFHGTHKCPNETTYCEYKPNREMNVRHAGWARGSYICRCRLGYYSMHHPEGFNGSLVEGNIYLNILTIASIRIVDDPKLTCGLDTLQFRRDFGYFCVLYRIYNGECSGELFDMVTSSPFQTRTYHRWLAVHPHTLKSSRNATTPRFSRTFLSRMLGLWNGLPSTVYAQDYDLGLFKKGLKYGVQGQQYDCNASTVL